MFLFSYLPLELFDLFYFYSNTKNTYSYIDNTFEFNNNLLDFWKMSIEILSKNKKKAFLSSYTSAHKSTFTVRYYFSNEEEKDKIIKTLKKPKLNN